jgi:ABC-2 type transport system permease protein
MTTIYVLWMRQLKRFFRSRFRIVAALSQPVVYLLAFGYGFGPIFQRAGQGNYIQFLVPGIVVMGLTFGGLLSGMDVIWDRRFGFLKETLVAPVSRISIVIGRIAGGATLALFGGVMMIAISYLAGFRAAGIGALALGFVFMTLIAVLFMSFSSAAAATLEDFQAFQLLINYVIMPMFFLSGALFPLRLVTPTLRMIANFNPLAYGVDGLRSSLLATPAYFGIWADLGALAGLAAIGLFLGARAFSRMQV